MASFFSVLFVHATTVTTENVQKVLKIQIALSTIFMTCIVFPCVKVLPETFILRSAEGDIEVK
jgi:hypothetical protein